MNNPAIQFSGISMQPANEQNKLVHQWGSPSPIGFPTAQYQHMFIDECVEAQAFSTPRNIAIRCDDDEWSYEELWAHSARVACVLNRMCLSKEDNDQLRMGINIYRGLANVAAILGALRAKPVFVPLDTAFPIDRIQYMVAGQAHVLISQRSHSKNVEQLLSENYENKMQVQVFFWGDLVDLTEAAGASKTKSALLQDTKILKRSRICCIRQGYVVLTPENN